MEAEVEKLRSNLSGASEDAIETAATKWADNARALQNVSQQLERGRTGLDGQLGESTRAAAQASFGNAEQRARDRSEAMQQGREALVRSADALRLARRELEALDQEGAPAAPSKPDGYATMSQQDQVRADRQHGQDTADQQAALADRERRARAANDTLDRSLRSSADVMRGLNPGGGHQAGSGGGATGASGSPGSVAASDERRGTAGTEADPADEGSPGTDEGTDEAADPSGDPATGSGITGATPAAATDTAEATGAAPAPSDLQAPGAAAPIGGGASPAAAGGSAAPAASAGAPAAAAAGGAAVAAGAATGAAPRAAAASTAGTRPIGAAGRAAPAGALGRSGAAAGAAGAGRAGAAGAARAGAAGAGRAAGAGAARAGAAGAGRAGAAGAGRAAGAGAGRAGAAGTTAAKGGAAATAAKGGAAATAAKGGAAGAVGAGAQRRGPDDDSDREHVIAEQEIWLDDEDVAPGVIT